MGGTLRWFLRVLLALSVLAVLGTTFGIWWNARDTTVYAREFTEKGFKRIKAGMDVERVYAILGRPLARRREHSPERWCYGGATVVEKGTTSTVEDFFTPTPCVILDKSGVVIEVTGQEMKAVQPGMSTEAVLEVLGEPERRVPRVAQTLHYTEPGGEGLFRARIVALDDEDRVSRVISYHFYD